MSSGTELGKCWAKEEFQRCLVLELVWITCVEQTSLFVLLNFFATLNPHLDLSGKDQ